VKKRGIGIAGVIALILSVGVWVALPQHGGSLVPGPVVAGAESISAKEAPDAGRLPRAISGSRLWTRPPAEVAARSSRRHGFAWILRQLGATEEQLDKLADLDIARVIAELKQNARDGDAASINILGEIALQNCRLGRDDETVKNFVASQIRDVPAASTVDASWFAAVMHEDEAFYKNMNAACGQLSQNEVTSWVAARASQNDGASLWLMFRDANSLTEEQQLLRAAAAAGFPQAQFELAWAIVGGQQGAAGDGPARVNAGDLLRASQEHLPRSEEQLAICEYSGCDGVAVDVDAAIKHAREAAQRGALDAMAYIGPHLPAGQVSPDEVTAWSLVQASLQQRGCGGDGFSVPAIRRIVNTLNANNVSAQARILAEQYWQTYGAQMMTSIGCTS
jgi:TPR repeat protein